MLKKFHYSICLIPQLKMFVLRRWTMEIGLRCSVYLSERSVLLSIIETHVKIGLLERYSWTEYCTGRKCVQSHNFGIIPGHTKLHAVYVLFASWISGTTALYS